jgi:hypothetical protein
VVSVGSVAESSERPKQQPQQLAEESAHARILAQPCIKGIIPEIITAVAFDTGIFLLVFGFAVGAIRLLILARDHDATEEKTTP